MNVSGGTTTFRTAEIQPAILARNPSSARPYPAHLTLAPSALRPHCLARERLLRWQPPPSANASTGSPLDRRRVFDVAAHAWSENTRQTYGSGLLIFHAFCDANAIAEDTRAPADRALVSLFIANLAGSYSVSAITNYIAALAAWHTLHGLSWCTNEAEVMILIKGAARLAPARKALRPPFTVSMLSAVLSQCSQTVPVDCAFAAALTTCFWGTARLGEIVIPKQGAFDCAKHPTPAHVHTRQDARGNLLTSIHIPSTKAAQLDGEDIYWAPQPGILDPAAAMKRHLAVNSPSPTTHLFAYRTASGNSHPLTRNTFLSRLKSAALAAGVTIPTGGHSIRIGSTTEYLLRGIPFDVVRAKGRWKSDSFYLYLRHHADVIAPYLQANADALAELSRRIAMPPPR